MPYSYVALTICFLSVKFKHYEKMNCVKNIWNISFSLTASEINMYIICIISYKGGKLTDFIFVVAGSHVHSIRFTSSFPQGNRCLIEKRHSFYRKNLRLTLAIFCRFGRRVGTILLSGFVILLKLVHTRLGARNMWVLIRQLWWDGNVCRLPPASLSKLVHLRLLFSCIFGPCLIVLTGDLSILLPSLDIFFWRVLYRLASC